MGLPIHFSQTVNPDLLRLKPDRACRFLIPLTSVMFTVVACWSGPGLTQSDHSFLQSIPGPAPSCCLSNWRVRLRWLSNAIAEIQFPASAVFLLQRTKPASADSQ